MTYVITEPCVGNKDQSCLEVCPVDCIQGDGSTAQYYIDPAECIDCGACVPACPVDAIYHEHEVPAEWAPFVAVNAAHFEAV